MLFACGTRDASGTATGAPNPLVGALDLTLDGQKMFLNAVGRALSQPLALSSTWGQYDLNETVNGAPGILALTNESATGFTAAIGENTLDVDGNAGVDQPGRPRIFQTFNPQALSVERTKPSLGTPSPALPIPWKAPQTWQTQPSGRA